MKKEKTSYHSVNKKHANVPERAPSSRCRGVEHRRPVRIRIQREQRNPPRGHGQQGGEDADHFDANSCFHLQPQSDS